MLSLTASITVWNSHFVVAATYKCAYVCFSPFPLPRKTFVLSAEMYTERLLLSSIRLAI